jgi:hypothetical protein
MCSDALALMKVVPAGTEVQVDPAAVPLDLVVILGRAVRRCPEQRCCFTDGVCDVSGDALGEHSRAGEPLSTATDDADGGGEGARHVMWERTSGRNRAGSAGGESG